jgi:hypothetical protein
MTAVLTVLACAAAFVLLGLLTRNRAPRLGFDFTEAGRVSERCSACEAPCDRPESTDD